MHLCCSEEENMTLTKNATFRWEVHGVEVFCFNCLLKRK